MEEKIFEFMEKMYSDITKRFDSVENKLDKKADKSDIVRMENDLKPKVETALESYTIVRDKLMEHYKRFDNIDSKIDTLSMRMNNSEAKFEVFEGGKKNTL